MELKLKSGDTLTQEVDFAKGDPREPMTDEDLMDKFYGLTKPYLSDEQRTKIAGDITNIESFKTLDQFIADMVMTKS